MKIVLFYHREDNDGAVSAALLYHFYQKNLKDLEEIKLFPSTYSSLKEYDGEFFENLHEDYEVMVMTDISFNNVEMMKKCYELWGSKFIWFDHHRPAIKESERHSYCNASGLRLLDRSAIACVWRYLYDPVDNDWIKLHESLENRTVKDALYNTEYFYDKFDYPVELYMLSAYDSWTYHKNDFNYIYNFNTGFTFLFDLDVRKIIANYIDSIVDLYYNKTDDLDSMQYLSDADGECEKVGQTISEYKKKVNADLCANSADDTFKLMHRPDLKVLTLFMQGATNSLVFESVKDKYDVGLVFKYNPNDTWTISMYTTHDEVNIDCGNYCKTFYDGGGHKGAAGCQISQAQFIDILKSKKF